MQYVLGKGNSSAFISDETSPDKKASGQHTWENIWDDKIVPN